MPEETIYIRMPSLIGKIEPEVERELTLVFMDVFEHIKNVYRKLGIDIRSEVISPSATVISRQPSQREKEANLAGTTKEGLGQRVIGSQVQDPIVEQTIPKEMLSSDLVKVAGAIPVGGKIIVKDGNGNSVEVLTS